MNNTASNVVKFTGSPRSVDSVNADVVTPPEKFTHCPRGREVNVIGGGVNGERESFTVPDVPKKQLEALYPKEYNSFRSMKYKRCGKDGKYICHPEVATFPKFLAAFGPIPEPGYTLDRLDPTDLEYAPGKCKWASKQRQAENKTNTKFLEISDGTRLSISEWSRRSGIPRKTILRRIELGWSHGEAVGIKAGGKRTVTTSSSAPKSLFPDSVPTHLQQIYDAWVKGFVAHSEGFEFLLEWKHVRQLEYIQQGLYRYRVPALPVIQSVMKNWYDFSEWAAAGYSAPPYLPDLGFLKARLSYAVQCYLWDGGELIPDEEPTLPTIPATPIDIERDL